MKFSRQFLTIFSKPVRPSDIDLARFEVESDAAYARRARMFQARRTLAFEVEEARLRWQAAVDESYRLKMEYISTLARFDPAFVRSLDTRETLVVLTGGRHDGEETR